MSYIRSTENPEGLYIWGDGQGFLSIAVGTDKLLHIPKATFHGIMLKWWEEIDGIQGGYAATFEGASMRAEFREFLGSRNLVFILRHESWKEDQEVVAMLTTWHYLFRDVVDREALAATPPIDFSLEPPHEEQDPENENA